MRTAPRRTPVAPAFRAVIPDNASSRSPSRVGYVVTYEANAGMISRSKRRSGS